MKDESFKLNLAMASATLAMNPSLRAGHGEKDSLKNIQASLKNPPKTFKEPATSARSSHDTMFEALSIFLEKKANDHAQRHLHLQEEIDRLKAEQHNLTESIQDEVMQFARMLDLPTSSIELHNLLKTQEEHLRMLNLKIEDFNSH
jgi:hypothetical protein